MVLTNWLKIEWELILNPRRLRKTNTVVWFCKHSLKIRIKSLNVNSDNRIAQMSVSLELITFSFFWIKCQGIWKWNIMKSLLLDEIMRTSYVKFANLKWLARIGCIYEINKLRARTTLKLCRYLLYIKLYVKLENILLPKILYIEEFFSQPFPLGKN